LAAPPSSTPPPVAPEREAPLLLATAALPDIVQAAAMGLLGLILGLAPVAVHDKRPLCSKNQAAGYNGRLHGWKAPTMCVAEFHTAR